MTTNNDQKYEIFRSRYGEIKLAIKILDELKKGKIDERTANLRLLKETPNAYTLLFPLNYRR